jgi:hypothetical protein
MGGYYNFGQGGGTPGGADKEVEYNNNGAFGGIDNGTSGQVLTSNGASSTPSFQNATAGPSNAPAVSNQFVTAYNSTTKAFSQAQPAFTNVSGSVAASQLPNPSASTLGGVQSKAAVSHNFLTSIGTDGTVTQAQPTSADISGLVSPGTVLLGVYSASNSAAVTCVTRTAGGAIIQSDYTQYMVVFENIIPQTTGQAFQMQVSTDGGSTYVSGTSYNYVLIYMGISDSLTGVGLSGQAAINLANSVSTTANYTLNGEIQFSNPGSAAANKSVRGQIAAMAGGNLYYWNPAGIYTATTAVNAFQFKFASGNIVSGNIYVFALAKS